MDGAIMKIDFQSLKTACKFVDACAGNNKLLPLTYMLGVKVENGELSLLSTDSSVRDTKYYVDGLIDCEDFSVTIDLKSFTGLVSKLNLKGSVDLTKTDKCLVLKTNTGEYKYPFVSDEDGFIKFPDFVSNLKLSRRGSVLDLEELKYLIKNGKFSLATDFTCPEVCNYYFGDYVISTDLQVVTIQESNNIFGGAFLFRPEDLKILCGYEGDKLVKFQKQEDGIVFYNEDFMYYLRFLNYDIQNYPVEELTEYLQMESISHCELNTDEVFKTLNLLSVFADKDSTLHVRFDPSCSVRFSLADSKNAKEELKSTNACIVNAPTEKVNFNKLSQAIGVLSPIFDTVRVDLFEDSVLMLSCEDIKIVIALED